jgi:hypothetical protein
MVFGMRYYSTAPFVEALDINVFRIFSQRLLAVRFLGNSKSNCDLLLVLLSMAVNMLYIFALYPPPAKSS